jgi:hypothetical protein
MSESTIATRTSADVELTDEEKFEAELAAEVAETEATENTPHSDVTPFQAAGVASKILGKDITPQSMYGLAKNKTIAGNYDEYLAAGGRGHGIKVMFDGEAFFAWLKAAKAGNVQSAGRRSLDSLVDEFAV